MAQRYEYKVVELRESLMGGKMSGEKLSRRSTSRLARVGSSGRSPRSRSKAASGLAGSRGCWSRSSDPLANPSCGKASRKRNALSTWRHGGAFVFCGALA